MSIVLFLDIIWLHLWKRIRSLIRKIIKFHYQEFFQLWMRQRGEYRKQHLCANFLNLHCASLVKSLQVGCWQNQQPETTQHPSNRQQVCRLPSTVQSYHCNHIVNTNWNSQLNTQHHAYYMCTPCIYSHWHLGKLTLNPSFIRCSGPFYILVIFGIEKTYILPCLWCKPYLFHFLWR